MARGSGKAWWIALVVVIVLVAGGVGGYFLVNSGGGETPAGTESVSSGMASTLGLSGGASVTIPAGAVAGSGTVSGKEISAPAPAPTGLTLVGATYQFEVVGTRLTKAVTVRLPLTIGVQDGYPPAALVVYFDTSKHGWTPVPATYDASAHMMVAQTSHLSIWGLASVTHALENWALGRLKTFLGVNDVAAQPSCPGAAQAASDGITVHSSSGSLVKWCVGEQNGEGLLTVTDDRAFAVEVDYPANWVVHREGWPDLDSAVVEGVAGALSPAPRGEKSVIVPGGESVDFDVAAGDSGQAQVTPSAEAYLVSVLLYGVDTLIMTTEKLPWVAAAEPGAALSVIHHLFGLKDCIASVHKLDASEITSPSAALSLFWTDMQAMSSCLGDAWEAAYGATGELTHFLVDAYEWLLNGRDLVYQGIGGIIESVVYWQSYRIELTSPAVQPVLGNVWGPYQKGYGQVAPPLVFNGGDPTGAVEGITWSSWGGSTATGIGTSDYVPPGGSVAGGTQDPVTIVAFDLGICGGKLMYQAIEWYFPEHGETFNPNVYINICTGTYVGYP
jgi:hypothetical protein